MVQKAEMPDAKNIKVPLLRHGKERSTDRCNDNG